ncbi:unnamed protein product [Polarella glacialis]|uniref:Nuclear migration protein nudC n=1 Tax=Polarella glacialis TaxID=89957 RepID=A0A813LE43_POLGL|nr:unnamed protein product [Polarella glacialis]
MADGRFDEMLLGMAQKHKGIEDLMYTLMSFLERRTDLLHVKAAASASAPADEKKEKGFEEGAAEEMLRKQFNQFQGRYLARAQPHLLAPPRTGGEQRAITPSASPSSSSSVSAPARRQVPDGVNASPLNGGDPGQWERLLNEGKGFAWNQTTQEVTIEINMEKSSASDIKVIFASKSLTVKRKGEVIVEGRLFDKISCDDSTWHLDSGKQVVISLEKIKAAFWDNIFEDAPASVA